MKSHRSLLSGSRGRAPFPLIVAVTACGTLGMHLIIPALPATAKALQVSQGITQGRHNVPPYRERTNTAILRLRQDEHW